MPPIPDLIESAAAVATAVGVLIAGRQLQLAKQQAITSFEDQLASQYREIARRLPVEALLGEELDAQAYAEALPEFYHYFDLSNEQAYLHDKRRIRNQTWDEWKEGIQQNLNRPAFARAWAEVSRRAPDSFNDLRRHLLPQSAISVRSRGTHRARLLPDKSLQLNDERRSPGESTMPAPSVRN